MKYQDESLYIFFSRYINVGHINGSNGIKLYEKLDLSLSNKICKAPFKILSWTGKLLKR